MTAVPRLHWTLQHRMRWPAVGVLVLAVALGAGLVAWKQQLDARLATSQERLARADAQAALVAARDARPTHAPSAMAARQLEEQLALLNRDWVALSSRLVPREAGVRLLGLDANPATGALRVTGSAPSAEHANAYAEQLGGDTGLRDVRLLGLERSGSLVKFEVGAQWMH
jgi:hypothetical protein